MEFRGLTVDKDYKPSLGNIRGGTEELIAFIRKKLSVLRSLGGDCFDCENPDTS